MSPPAGTRLLWAPFPPCKWLVISRRRGLDRILAGNSPSRPGAVDASVKSGPRRDDRRSRGSVRDQREQPLGGGVLPAARDTKLAEQAREISRRQQRTVRVEALVERQTHVAAALGAALTGEPS